MSWSAGAQWARELLAPDEQVKNARPDETWTIPLKPSGIAKVNLQDYLALIGYSYRRTERNKAQRYEGGKTIYMHQDVARRMGVAGLVDHINHDTLDNRRANLRPCTQAQNNLNRRKRTKGRNTSQYKGVYARHGKWAAACRVNGVRTWLGYHDSEEAAARAYDKAALELHGEFAAINFPKDLQ